MINKVEENTFSNKFVIDLIVDFLEKNTSSINKKINNVVIKELNKSDKKLASRFKTIFTNSEFTKGVSSRSYKSNINSTDFESKNNFLLEKKDSQNFNNKVIVWDDTVKQRLDNIILEHNFREKLTKENLHPSNTLLFYGLPGVGKTLAAKCLSEKLQMPLYVLDLASIMSSYLGKTGSNIKSVFDFASENKCILLLDEFDAIAKQRGDDSEIGELKRLVTVLLQAIDNWSSESILIAATNHQELLDKAIWRRFDEIIEFPNPNQTVIKEILKKHFDSIEKDMLEIFIESMKNKSHAYIFKAVSRIKKNVTIHDISLNKAISEYIINNALQLEKSTKINFSKILINELKLSQRKTSELLNISRDTIRRNLQ